MSAIVEPRRPRLLPQNRKLRHLKGLSLRNLSFAHAHTRTADDVDLNKSPSKLTVLRESGQLHVSRSSESLRQDSLAHDGSPNLQVDKLKRPATQSRRTSLSLVHASPVDRQKRLEALAEGVVGDAFFSLHVPGVSEPVYISELRERSANFNFQFFDLADQLPEVSRSCGVTVRLWSRRPKKTNWVFLLEEFVDLRRLNFVGTLVDRRFPPNALVFHLEDGLYSFDFPTRAAEPRQGYPVATSSYNALMKLANLKSSIDDAMETQKRIMQQINNILEDTPADTTDIADEQVVLSDKYLAAQRKANQQAKKKRQDLRESIQSRRQAIVDGRALQAKAEEDIANNQQQLEASKVQVEKTEQEIRGQRRRICSELSDIFSITPITNAPPLSFQICNLTLPNSNYDASMAKAVNEDVLSAGLGLVAILTRHLQFYLSNSLPYELFPYGSRSYIRDDISVLADKQAPRREFPLHLPRGGSTVGQWRFEYGWFLLNKNIEALCASQGLKVVDIRHSLPNLKYLLYVCSAGTDDMPERKKGGVRGLWAGRLKSRMSSLQAGLSDVDTTSSTNGSRRGSMDSEIMNQHGGTLRNALAGAGEADSRLSWGLDSGLSLPFDEGETKFTLRTKGLRENIAN